MIVIVFVAVAVLAVLLHGVVLRLLRGSVLGRSEIGKRVLDRGTGPSRLGFLVLGFAAAIPVLGFSAATATTLLRFVFAAFILVVGWTAIELIGLFDDLYLARLPATFEQDALTRKRVTQIRVLRRTGQVVLGFLSLAAALMTLPGVEQYGVSLFASAGAAGIIVGLAARPVLTNLLAGIQIAITQPIKVEDVVVVQGEWGRVEDITSTYVVIRIWDLRRLVVPLSQFLEQPFQNWTRTGSSLIGSVHFFVDFATPIDKIRSQLEAIVRESKLWDGKVVNLQVVEATDKALQLRALMSARNSSDAWDLRCEVREKVIEFLQQKMPEALPRYRLDREDSLGRDAGSAPALRKATQVERSERRRS